LLWVEPVTGTLKPSPTEGIGSISSVLKNVLSVFLGFFRLIILILCDGGMVIFSLMWAMISSASSMTGVRYVSARLNALMVRLYISCTEFGESTIGV